MLGTLVREQRDGIVERWLERVADDLGAHHMATTELRDAIPDFLDGLAWILVEGKSPQEASGGMWERVAEEHAVTRVQQGFDVDAVFKEFVLLRKVIYAVATEAGLGGVQTLELVTDSVDAAIEASVRRYMESRDMDGRRVEAQHVAFVAHELRNPLGTAALGLLQLREMSEADESTSRVLAVVERAHDKLRTLIDDVLTVEKGRAGEIAVNPEPTSLAAIVEEAVAPSRVFAERRGFELEVSVEQDHALTADPRLTVSAVHNLVDNAIKYSTEGPVQVWTETRADRTSIHVRDRCGGMPAEELASLFEPFQRGRHQGRGKGTGLGLSIVRQAVEAQGGEAHAEPADGGCHFWIELPVDPAAQ